MWCIAAACQRLESGFQPLKIEHIVEYLRYDLKNGHADICGDILVRNLHSAPISFQILHRGNIDLRNSIGVSGQRSVYDSMLGYVFEQQGIDPTLTKLVGDIKPTGPARNSDQHAPFSLFETPMIQNGDLYLLRVSGHLSGKNYRRLISESGYYNRQTTSSVYSIAVYGGDVLLKRIQMNDLEASNVPDDVLGDYSKDLPDYKEAFTAFKASKVNPGIYHVIVDVHTKDGCHLTVEPTSPGLQEGSIEHKVGSWTISHFYSRLPHFSAESVTNGLSMYLDVACAT